MSSIHDELCSLDSVVLFKCWILPMCCCCRVGTDLEVMCIEMPSLCPLFPIAVFPDVAPLPLPCLFVEDVIPLSRSAAFVNVYENKTVVSFCAFSLLNKKTFRYITMLSAFLMSRFYTSIHPNLDGAKILFIHSRWNNKVLWYSVLTR